MDQTRKKQKLETVDAVTVAVTVTVTKVLSELEINIECIQANLNKTEWAALTRSFALCTKEMSLRG